MKKILFLLLPLFFIACGENSKTNNDLTAIEYTNPNNKLIGLDNNSSLIPPSF
ncbi:hypothetical protein [Caminibacter mediatlanticus]|uniref:Lipoprotein n=1 Tax=Caminibacter mediatlanticus TB-2 TaxID=391592 RepID=A0AAI9AH31_9BACT|nr:hypothetical protein [Caminibacter mediatlanticus]EDM23364.1 hypothetical protein CMTB2_08870 [Caminibacter mediatlanticus TB-2]